jgi:hypothetical protein
MIRIEAPQLSETQAKLEAAQQAIAPDTGGLADILAVGLAQLERFTVANIEVDTGRTKNSIFPKLGQQGNSVVASLNTNVSYAPYVRDASHKQPFFDYAAKVEGPRVAKMLGLEVDIRVTKAFE